MYSLLPEHEPDIHKPSTVEPEQFHRRSSGGRDTHDSGEVETPGEVIQPALTSRERVGRVALHGPAILTRSPSAAQNLLALPSLDIRHSGEDESPDLRRDRRETSGADEPALPGIQYASPGVA